MDLPSNESAPDSVFTTNHSTPLLVDDKNLTLSRAVGETSPGSHNTNALAYWALQEPNDNGVLGGYGFLSSEDIRGSLEFYKRVRRKLEKWRIGVTSNLAADVGGGVGRVTKLLLLKLFAEVDIVEPVERMRGAIPDYINNADEYSRVSTFDATLETWEPSASRNYDLVWLQWVCMFVSDDCLINALRRLSSALRCDSGIIIIKDNVAPSKSTIRDLSDNSSCRCMQSWLDLFSRAGLSVIATAQQRHWPAHLYNVQMFALMKSRETRSQINL